MQNELTKLDPAVLKQLVAPNASTLPPMRSAPVPWGLPV